MANLSVNKYHIDLNNTRYNNVAAELYYGPSRVRLLWYNGTKVYNCGYYELIMPDIIEVESPGGHDALTVINESIISRKTDAGNVVTNNIAYTMEPADLTIPPNYTETPIIGTFKIKQTLTDLLLTGTYLLAACVLNGYSYSNLRIINVYYEYEDAVAGVISASGGSATLYVEYAVDRKPIVDSGADMPVETEYGGTSSISSVTGNKYSYSHVSFDSNTGTVSADSLRGDSYANNIDIAYVSGVSISATFVCPISGTSTTLSATWTSSGTSSNVICKLQYNIIEDSVWNTAVLYLNNTTNNVDCVFDAKGGSDTVEIDSYRDGYYIYTSGYEEETTANVIAYISSSNTSVAVASSNSVSGLNKNVTIYAEQNNHNTSNVSATITVSNSGCTRYIYVTVEGDYVYYDYSGYTYESAGTEEISAAGGSTPVYVTFSRLRNSYWYSDDSFISSTSSSGLELATNVTTSVSTNIGTASGGVISVGSRERVTGNARVIYTINNVTCSKGTFSTGGYQVWLEANELIGSNITGYYLSVSAAETDISNDGDSTTLYVDAIKYITYSYTSGDYTDEEGTTATLSANKTWATIDPTVVANGGSATLTISANTSSSERTVDIIAKVGSYESDPCTITQSAHVQPERDKASINVVKCSYTSTARTQVEYEFYFDATDTSEYAGGTFSNVYVLLMDKLDGSGNTIDSDSIGTITVSEGSTSDTYSGTLNVGSSTNRYLVIKDSSGVLFSSDIEDPEV